MIAHPELPEAVRRLVKENVHHVAVFVKQRCQDLEHARAAFPERHVAVELLFQ